MAKRSTVTRTRQDGDHAPSRRIRSVANPTSLGDLDVGSKHPLLPRLHQPSPGVSVRQHAYERLLSHHLFRQEPLITRLVNAAGELYIGTGPVPISRFAELDDLWCAMAHRFDNTGRRNLGAMIRQDGHRTFMLDGEFFVRRRDRTDAPEAATLEVPVEWEIHGSQFCPLDYSRIEKGMRWTNGIAHVRSKPVAYKFWSDDPFNPWLGSRLLDFDRSEIYHVADPMLGAVRGRPILAGALLRTIKMTTLEDSELRRKQVASLISIFAERPADADPDEGALPSDEEVDDMLDAISLTPGGVFQLPYGYKISSFEPKDEPANFEKALRWQIMMIAMSVGIPLNELMGDEGVERWGRMMSQRVQRQADLVHDMYEHQFLNRMRMDFVDHVMEAGLWSPPVGMKPWELYQCTWQWPVIPAARLDQELRALMEAVEKGHLPHSHVSRTLFGMSPEVVARTSARDAARQQALGLQATQTIWKPDTEVAVRIGEAALAEEIAERDLVEQAALEDSVMD